MPIEPMLPEQCSRILTWPLLQVRFGPLRAEDGVSVTLSPSLRNAPAGVAAVIVQAVQFITHKARELRSDTALAHLDMLRGGPPCHRVLVGCGVTGVCCGSSPGSYEDRI